MQERYQGTKISQHPISGNQGWGETIGFSETDHAFRSWMKGIRWGKKSENICMGVLDGNVQLVDLLISFSWEFILIYKLVVICFMMFVNMWMFDFCCMFI